MEEAREPLWKNCISHQTWSEPCAPCVLPFSVGGRTERRRRSNGRRRKASDGRCQRDHDPPVTDVSKVANRCCEKTSNNSNSKPRTGEAHLSCERRQKKRKRR